MRVTNEPAIGQQRFQMGSSMKIGRVSLNVSNLKRSLDFYEKILGFKVVRKISGENAVLSVNGSSSFLLELVQVKAGSNQDTSVSPVHTKRAGLYHFAILLPERKYLADMLQNLGDKNDQIHFDGFADHLVSESIYIRDPDFIGIEIYRDRSPTEWHWSGDRLDIATLPLNRIDLLREATDNGWREMPKKTEIGHVHLHVSSIEKAIRFYRDILGLNLTAIMPSAAFFAAANYHHHIAANTWLGTDIMPASPEVIGLNHFTIELSSKEQFQKLTEQVSQSGNALTTMSETSGFIHDMDGIKIRVQCK